MTMIMVVLMMIKRRFFTLFCPRGPGGPPEAVIILNDRPLLQKTLVHYCTTDPLKCKAHFKAEKKRKRLHIYFISPLFPIQHIDVTCRIYIDISIDKNSRFFIYFLLFITWGARMLGWWFGCVCVCVWAKTGGKYGQENAENSSESAPGSPLVYPAFKNSFRPCRHCPQDDEADFSNIKVGSQS